YKFLLTLIKIDGQPASKTPSKWPKPSDLTGFPGQDDALVARRPRAIVRPFRGGPCPTRRRDQGERALCRLIGSSCNPASRTCKTFRTSPRTFRPSIRRRAFFPISRAP